MFLACVCVHVRNLFASLFVHYTHTRRGSRRRGSRRRCVDHVIFSNVMSAHVYYICITMHILKLSRRGHAHSKPSLRARSVRTCFLLQSHACTRRTCVCVFIWAHGSPKHAHLLLLVIKMRSRARAHTHTDPEFVPFYVLVSHV